MNLPRVLVLALTAICMFGFANSAAADPIVYTVSANASGSIGGTPFSNVPVNVSLFSDTATVQPLAAFPPLVVNVGTTFIGITGIGLSLVTDPTLVFSTVMPAELDDDFPILPYVGIGTIDNPPNVDSFTGIGVGGSNLLAGYNLTTAIGPITTSPGGIGYPSGLVIHTSRGNLIFTENPQSTGAATFTAALLVPEPSSLLTLCAAGLVLLFVRHAHRARVNMN